jgi:chromosome segregation ATPase
MTATPLTDNLARGNHVVPTEFAQDLERERDNLTDQRDFAISEVDRLEEERDQARNLGDAAMWEADRLYGQLWRARDRAWKLARQRNHWKADCLEQCKLLAMGADREEKLLQQVAALKSQISNLKSP